MHGVFYFFCVPFPFNIRALGKISDCSASRFLIRAPLALYFRDAYADFLAVFAP